MSFLNSLRKSLHPNGVRMVDAGSRIASLVDRNTMAIVIHRRFFSRHDIPASAASINRSVMIRLSIGCLPLPTDEFVSGGCSPNRLKFHSLTWKRSWLYHWCPDGRIPVWQAWILYPNQLMAGSSKTDMFWESIPGFTQLLTTFLPHHVNLQSTLLWRRCLMCKVPFGFLLAPLYLIPSLSMVSNFLLMAFWSSIFILMAWITDSDTENLGLNAVWNWKVWVFRNAF